MTQDLPKPKHSEHGYTNREVLDIIRPYKIHHKTFWSKFGVNTCGLKEIDGKQEMIFYPVDIERTLALCLRYRKVSIEEWD